jgi:hypothetical protein
MIVRAIVAVAVAIAAGKVQSAEKNGNTSGSYPIKINSDEVREFSSLTVDFANFKLQGNSITVVPISTEAGITGAVLLGTGMYSYTTDTGKKFEGQFHAAMLRYNPKDAEAVLKLTTGKVTKDKGAADMATSLLATIFRHCYHSGQSALLTTEKALAVDLFSRELGEVLFSFDGNVAIVHSFSDRQTLYEKK